MDRHGPEFYQFHGSRKMGSERRNRGVGIAPQHGLDDLAMFGIDVTQIRIREHRQLPIAFALLVKRIAEPQQPSGTAGAYQRPVENAVAREPSLAVDLGI